MAKRIGLSGGIGSGKSTVAKLFSQHDIAIYDADKVAHELMQPHTKTWQKIITQFSPDILNDDQTINRKKLGNIVFNNKTRLAELEAIMHPDIRLTLFNKSDQDNGIYCILEIQLLIENKLYEHMDQVIIVTCEDNIRRQRLKASRDLSDNKIDAIMNNQLSDKERVQYADYIIENNDSIESLAQQVETLHQHLIQA